ncbi:GH1 family beta-glucosidase [Ruminococcus gauvreauii]|uniref:Beta-glucosidase n=1 Tax=Ruminococcus gauvreauii TaxID=438033 RepID=A0ABY5VCP7_9FIRM|nr:GH1 family beta-glucosidase [Ruminococcus gauvreauii]UWP58304.1 GH1 family beta-glucosidase [Ruminococcus gauvreauii]
MNRYDFPKDFLWGTASSSYQIEGAWNEDGKGESIWDRLVHIQGNVADNTTGDVAADFYHRYGEDIDTMGKLGYQSFLYTISWPRILPKGVGEVNRKGVEYYRSVFQKCREHGIRTMAVLYHWDLPQALQDRGGWANREIVTWFTDYANICYQEFGDLVDDWITFVEPLSVLFGFNGSGYAPAHNDYHEFLQAGHHVFLCHGEAVKAFRKTGLGSRIGIKISLHMMRPYDPECAADREKTELISMSYNDYIMDPILKGSYTEKLMEAYAAAGVKMPEVEAGDMETICQPVDFFGLNTYNPHYVEADKKAWPLGANVLLERKPNYEYPRTDHRWLMEETCFYDAIHYVYDNYPVDNIIVTESGCASNDWKDCDGKVHDPNRITYLKNDLLQIHRAIQEGVPITGYHIWSYHDNFEWIDGLGTRFGLVYIDYKTLERTPKDSAYWYAEVIKHNGFEVEHPGFFEKGGR